jgi:hypothetical protein
LDFAHHPLTQICHVQLLERHICHPLFRGFAHAEILKLQVQDLNIVSPSRSSTCLATVDEKLFQEQTAGPVALLNSSILTK